MHHQFPGAFLLYLLGSDLGNSFSLEGVAVDFHGIRRGCIFGCLLEEVVRKFSRDASACGGLGVASEPAIQFRRGACFREIRVLPFRGVRLKLSSHNCTAIDVSREAIRLRGTHCRNATPRSPLDPASRLAPGHLLSTRTEWIDCEAMRSALPAVSARISSRVSSAPCRRVLQWGPDVQSVPGEPGIRSAPKESRRSFAEWE